MFLDKTLALHAVLAVGGMGMAYAAFATPAQETEEGIELLTVRPELLQTATWKDAGNTVTLTKSGNSWNVTLANKEGESKSYPTTARTSEVVTQLAPLRAIRELGAADATKLASFGLDKPFATLELGYNGKTETLEVGNATYGNSGYYVKHASGSLYLVKASVFTDLKNGGHSLAEKVLLPIKREDVARVEIVRTSGGTRELVQAMGNDRAKAFYADVSAPEKKLAQTTNWVDRLLRLRISDVGVAPAAGDPEITATFFDTKGELGNIKIWSLGETHAVATSTRFASAVTVSKGSAEAILKDLQSVLEEKAD